MPSPRIGFSTGALAKGDFHGALEWMRGRGVRNVELSALRFEELKPLVLALDSLDLSGMTYVSFHAPSSFAREQEATVIELLRPVVERGWNVVVHPDVIYDPACWAGFGDKLLLENMDRRKATGRTVNELDRFFEVLPDARLCLDVAHARQLDTTLTILQSLIRAFKDRIAEVHISELDSKCRHRPLSSSAVSDYQRFADELDEMPVIIESMLDESGSGVRDDEFRLAGEAMTAAVAAVS